MSDRYGSSLAEAHRKVARSFKEADIEAAHREARDLVAHIARIEPTRLMLGAGCELSAEQQGKLDQLVRERLNGRTLARLIGRKRFHDIELLVNDEVLEPRSDTEALVELALPYLRNAADQNGHARFVDVGTGTGAVALALLQAEPRAIGVGTDLSPAAVQLARANAEKLGLSCRFQAVCVDLLDGVRPTFDLIVSNPPYIPTQEVFGLSKEVQRDPMSALDGGVDGLHIYRRLANDARVHLARHGRCALEIGAGQRRDVEAIFEDAGWRPLGCAHDLSGHERALAFAIQA